MKKLYMYLVVFFVGFLPALHSNAQTFNATFDAPPPGCPDFCPSFTLNLAGVDFQFTFLSDGDGGSFKQISNSGEGNSASIELQSGDFILSTTEKIVIKRSNGGDFRLTSLFVDNLDGSTVTVQAFNNGSSVGPAVTVSPGSNRTATFGDIYVDELVLTATDFFHVSIDSFKGSVPQVPTTVGTIPNVVALENDPNSTINLQSYFDDAEDGAAGLTYTVLSTDPAFFSTSINGSNQLIIDYANSGVGGPHTVTVRATDTDGFYADQAFTVTVNGSNVTFNASGTESFTEANSTKTFIIEKVGTTNFSSQVNFAISGTATLGTDYTNIGGTSGANSTSGTIVFAAGESSKTITVDILDDAMYEDNKTIILSLSGASATGSGSADIGTSSATKTIVNDDAPPAVSLSPVSSSVNEDAGTATVKAVLSTVSEKDVTVNLSFSGTATGGGTDYTATNPVFIPAGSTEGTITITLTDDAIHEGNETVIIDIASVINGTESGIQQATLTILDNDPVPAVSLAIAGSPMVENGGQATVTATLSNLSSQDVTVNLSFSGTATGGGIDYSTSGNSITVPAGASSASITLTAVDDASGEGDETIIVDILSVVNGVESGTQQVTATITDDDKLPQTIDFIAIGDKTYGDANVTLSASASSGLPVRFESSNPAVASVSGNTLSILKAGSVTIKAIQDGDATYAYAEESQTITINKATLSVAADDKSKIYGDANPALTYQYSGFVNGDDASVIDTEPLISTAATTTSSVGTYDIVVSGGVDDNYNFVYTKGTLTINKANLEVVADNKNKTYGQANPALTLSYTGFKNGDTESVLDTRPTASTTATTTSPVGDYPITASGGSDNNYFFTYTSGTLTVNKAALTVTADNKSKVYGETNPALTLSYSGFVNGENASVLDAEPTLSTTATETSPVGTYPITVGGGADNNYAFNYVPGTLTITKATLTVKADDKSKIYGDANPALTLTYSGFVNGDDVADLTTAPTASTVADANSSVGTYPITVSGGVDENYAFTYTSGALTIGKAPLAVTADNKNRAYGEENPPLTVTYSGFKNGDTENVLDTKPIASTTATKTSEVGTYVITVSGGVDNNYEFTYHDGTLIINRATLTVTADNKTRAYSESNPAFTLTYSGFMNGDTESVLDTKPTATTIANASSAPGDYPIEVSGGADNNYAFVYLNGTLTIVNNAPVFTSTEVTSVNEDASYNYNITADDVDNGDVVAIVATTKADWMSFTDNGDGTALLTGVPTNAEVGTHNVVLKVTDKFGEEDEQNFTVTVTNVNDAPTFTSTAITNATEDVEYTYNVTASDVDAGDNITISGTTIPAWLTLTDNGNGAAVLQGTPTNDEVGDHAVVLTVTDIAGATDTQNFTITVTNVNDAPTLAGSIADQEATEDEAFSLTFDAALFEDVDAGDALTYSATLSDGTALPAWLSFDAVNRTFSGTPLNENVGVIEVSLTATDKEGASVSDIFQITVANVNDAPVVAIAIPDQRAYKEQSFTYSIPAGSFIDVDAGDVLTYSATSAGGAALPAWLSFNATTQTFSGTPSLADLGNYNIVVIAKDQSNALVTDEFVITVADPNNVPTDILLSSNEVEENQPTDTFVGSFTTKDSDANDVHAYSLITGEGSTDNGLFYISGNSLYTNTSFDYEMKSSYSIRVASNDGNDGLIQKVFTIYVVDVEDVRAFLPNLFSPNGDGNNDRFILRANGVSQLTFKIFDRMGNMVYETNDVMKATQQGWDGTYKGEKLSSGSYVWQLSGKFSDGTALSVDGKNVGNITLIR